MRDNGHIFGDQFQSRRRTIDRRNSAQAVRVFRLPISRTASGIGRKEGTAENEDFEEDY
ncbi:hypothetical protein M413DRAFT_439307 [Hebeloma cylindrosporum]|uniref:Uncharacterized protein n=1 Tax=Hebeloma cylindrosporum TaxID=76867 RepID=A0A0C3CU63_HEBCY|nr:hypothetical protein M413DRAFT_439307 [Hebeloma cylindrosporum h7]